MLQSIIEVSYENQQNTFDLAGKIEKSEDNTPLRCRTVSTFKDLNLPEHKGKT